ncbi:MAG TPA: hypothetical protein VGN88_01665 [Phycisphaerae bacterium]
MVESSTTPVSPISAPDPSGPRDVVASFLRLTVDTPDLKKAKLHLSKRSLDSGLVDVSSVPAGSTYTLGAQEADDLGARIPVNVKSPVPGSSTLQEMTVPVIVVQEEGEWKIDLPATMERLLGGAGQAIGEAMGQVGEVLSAAMTGIGDAMASSFATEPAPTPAPLRKSSKPSKPVKKAPKKVAKKAAKSPAKKPIKKKSLKTAKKTAKKQSRKIAKKSTKPSTPKPAKKKRR